ncbi:hypothetical protein [Natronorarus salvus]|uniref:hypothetical protein n=1 Tax=Natronorarus salvus TaxID=3117733 RepID=UPI002F266F72
MSETETEVKSILGRLDELVPGIRDGLKRLKTAIVENSDDEELIETAENLWEIVDETEDVLEALDLEEIPDVIDVDELPDAVDVEDIPDALGSDDPGEAIDLSDLKEAIRFRELWEVADIGELREEQEELEEAVDDVTDDEELVGDDDDDGDSLLDMGLGGQGAHMQFDPDDRQEAIRGLIEEAVSGFRAALLDTHDTLRLLWEFNNEKLGGRESLNPTAVSTMPRGPIPDSASTRHSTVPSQVRYSRAQNPRRIYGKRFEDAEGGVIFDEEDDEETEDGEADANGDTAEEVENDG